MHRIIKLFGPESDPIWFLPIHGKDVLIPSELDIQRKDYLLLSEEGKYNHRELIRLNLLKLIHNGHSIFGQNQSLDEIIKLCKELYNLNDAGFLIYHDHQKYLTHTNHNVSNQWFPEMYDTKINGKSCLDQIRNHDEFHKNFYDIFDKDRHKAGERSNNTKCISDTIFDSMRIVNGYQPAFNFPASLAMFIYMENYKSLSDKANEFRVLDPCMGWSGRMTGLLAAFCTPLLRNTKVLYHGTDVNTLTKGRFKKIVGFWNYYLNSDIDNNFDLHRSFTPAEQLMTDPFFIDKENFYDFAFTSPPYYTKEHYSEDDTQSYKMYLSYPAWRDGFLYGLIFNTFKLLKPGARFWLNIADINTNRGDRTFYPLESDSLKLAEKIGFKHIDTYYMTQHPFPGSKPKKNIVIIEGKKHKIEPIFVFEKP